MANALAAASIGLGVWVRTEGPGALAAFAGPLIVGGIVLALGGLGALLWALVHARQERGLRRVAPKPPAKPKPGG
ncbi:MAG: hypothetical protein WBL06_08745 [Pseudolysinimonas sp.]|uniref:hypothetical protein n=1 Tax=Pseudolysinimonas sp. TaxID=2680009 RepID=UPI003C74F179